MRLEGLAMRKITMALGLLALCIAPTVRAQTKPCSLLTAQDISVVGATGQGIASSMNFPDGTAKGGTMYLCQWVMSPGGLMMSTARVPAGASQETLANALNQSWTALKSKGWKEEKQAFGAVSCFLMTPPPADKSAPSPTSCTVFTKGFVLSIVTMGTTRVEIVKVKALVDAAAARL
jgi:hypothetical protein